MTTTLLAEHETTEVLDRPVAIRPSLRDTVDQSLAMAWRALKKMRRNPEQWFDVTVQPLLFTAMFAYIFGGAISGSVQDYLPILITGILAQTALTACMATGMQLREDMDKGVFDRFKSLPIARIAPLVGPAIADLVRYGTAATLTILTGLVMGYRPGGGVPGVVGGWLLTIVAGWSLAWARAPLIARTTTTPGWWRSTHRNCGPKPASATSRATPSGAWMPSTWTPTASSAVRSPKW